MRKALADSITNIASENDRVVFLTGDLGFQVFDNFNRKFGPRYINVGVAEALLIDAASGLALEGFRPLAYSIASFLTGRAFEQIRISVAYPHLPVVLVGAGGGFLYSHSGVTHHAPDDVALMSLLPGMTVVVPGDPNEVRALIPQLLALDGPSYIRIGKFGELSFEAEAPIVLGKARRLQSGRKFALLAMGDMATTVLQAAQRLQTENIQPMIYQFHTVKPLDIATLDYLAGMVSTLVVVEESTPCGGLASAIMAWSSATRRSVHIVRLGPPDEFALGNVKHATLREQFGFGTDAIITTCRLAWTGNT